MSDRASELRAIADGRLMLNVRNGVTVSRSMLARIADEFEAMSTALEAQAARISALEAAIRGLLDCPDIADNDHKDEETHAAERAARAILNKDPSHD